MAKCKYCPQELIWKKPYTKGDFPVMPDGSKHNCPNRTRGGGNSQWNFNMFEPKTKPRIQYQYCGKCAKLTTEIATVDEVQEYDWVSKTVVGYWCKDCEMYPNVTYNGTEDGCSFEPNPNVKPLCDTNYTEIVEKYRAKNSDAPPNWSKMNEDGTMQAGYKSEHFLNKWFNEKGGKEIIKSMNAEIWHKKKMLN